MPMKTHLISDKNRHWLWLWFWPVYLLAFLAVERLIPAGHCHVMFHPLDAKIPFCEWFVIPYVYWYGLIAFSLAYTGLREPEVFRRLSNFYFLTSFSAILIFLLYPSCQNLRPQTMPRDNFLTRVMVFLYSADTNTNVCPSLHVVSSIGAALGLNQTRRFGSPRWKGYHGTVAALICASTVFVKQHSLWDVVWGAVMAYGVWFLVNRHPAPCVLWRNMV